MLVTVPVFVAVNDSSGAPVARAAIVAKLSQPEVYMGYVIPVEVAAITDDNGTAVLNLWPNVLGVTQSVYDIKIIPPSGKNLRLTATIPNRACTLAEVADVPPYPGKTDGQLASELAVAAADNAGASAAAAAESAAQAEEAEATVMRTLKHIGDEPPTDLVPGREWFNAANGRTYVWYVADGQGAWVEGYAAIVLATPDQAGATFDPSTLGTVDGITDPAAVNFLIEQGGIAYRITAAQMLSELGVEAVQLPAAGPLARTDIVTIVQGGGIEKQTTLEAVATAVDRINKGLL